MNIQTGWWHTHVAWRLKAHPPTDAGAVPRTPAAPASSETPPCTKCGTCVEDPKYRMCLICRAKANRNSKARARRAKRAGKCPKCGRAVTGDNVVCDACRAYARDKYGERGRADRMAGAGA